MLKKSIVMFLIVSLAMVSFASPALGANEQVVATIPTFPITLNELIFDNNDYAQYPLLVFRGITYFPMTYYQSRLLNLAANWTADDGLVITKGNAETPKEFQYEAPASNRNQSNQMASIVNAKVIVNGNVIDNKSEPYPLLLFRGITYFPLTWRFAVDEFGWSYSFDIVSGLSIRADNFFYVSGDDGSGYIDESSMTVSQTETHYIKGNMRITLKTSASLGWAGAVGSNLSIIYHGVEIIPDGRFGYYQRQRGPMFTVEDGFISTTYFTDQIDSNPPLVRVSIETGQIH